MKWFLCALFMAAGCAGLLPGAELKFDFAGVLVGDTPKGFTNLVAGQGPLGEWKIVRDAAPAAFPGLAQTQPAASRPVLAQLSSEVGAERFPLLLYTLQEFDDFTFSARFKVLGGRDERMAGLVFRAQDAKNFYVVRANAKDGNVRFYAVIDGRRTPPIGNNLAVPTNEWHELKVEAKGNRIACSFNGQKLGDYFTDTSFKSGKIGFWTMSDSVSYFADAMITYSPRESLAQTIVRDTVAKFQRLRGLRIYAAAPGEQACKVVASKDAKDLGQPGTKTEADILANGTIYHDKDKDIVTVYMPLRDRNGDAIAVVRVTMETFWGQTEKNVLARALPVVDYMQRRVLSLKELLE
jgi:hypothetical protein